MIGKIELRRSSRQRSCLGLRFRLRTCRRAYTYMYVHICAHSQLAVSWFPHHVLLSNNSSAKSSACLHPARMHVYMYEMYICMLVCKSVCMRVYAYVCLYVLVFTCPVVVWQNPALVFTLHVCTYACMYVCLYVSVCIYLYACMYVRSLVL
jgi:hypothetical protein